MTQSWWQYRQWKFVADMNGDGAVTIEDVRPWAEWLFFMPGDAVVALAGPTTLGSLLDLTPKSLGSGTSALLSVALWPVCIWALYQAWAFLLDAANPTLRQEYRERREAEAKARHARRELHRRIYRSRFLRRAWPRLSSGLVVLLVAALALAILKDLL